MSDSDPTGTSASLYDCETGRTTSSTPGIMSMPYATALLSLQDIKFAPMRPVPPPTLLPAGPPSSSASRLIESECLPVHHSAAYRDSSSNLNPQLTPKLTHGDTSVLYSAQPFARSLPQAVVPLTAQGIESVPPSMLPPIPLNSIKERRKSVRAQVTSTVDDSPLADLASPAGSARNERKSVRAQAEATGYSLDSMLDLLGSIAEAERTSPDRRTYLTDTSMSENVTFAASGHTLLPIQSPDCVTSSSPACILPVASDSARLDATVHSYDSLLDLAGSLT